MPVVGDDQRRIGQLEQRLRLAVPEARVQRNEDRPDVGGGEEQRYGVNRVVTPPDDAVAAPDSPRRKHRRKMVGGAGDLCIGELAPVVGDGDDPGVRAAAALMMSPTISCCTD